MASSYEEQFIKTLRFMAELQSLATKLDAPPKLIHDLPGIIAVHCDDKHKTVATAAH